MRRPLEQDTGQAGADSFLDVIANMVGIMIILVMIVSTRVRHSPPKSSEVTPPPASITSPEKVLKPLTQETASLESDVNRLAMQSRQLQIDLAGKTLQREKLALLLAAMEEEIQGQRQNLDQSSQIDFDLRSKMAVTRQELELLQKQRETVHLAAPQDIKIQSLPTPISRTVHGQEIHFQLRGGRVTHIPLDELLDTFQNTARHKVWKLEDQALMTDTIGPIGGFRMRYELGRFDLSPEEVQRTGRGGAVIRLVKWELLPVSLDLGETADEALKPGSEFLRAFERKDPSRVTITLWAYPDSFDLFRRLKAHLHSGGYAAAGRPLPDDQPIGGSPEGSRSAAQ
jgi:hypothetical protein